MRGGEIGVRDRHCAIRATQRVALRVATLVGWPPGCKSKSTSAYSEKLSMHTAGSIAPELHDATSCRHAPRNSALEACA